MESDRHICPCPRPKSCPGHALDTRIREGVVSAGSSSASTKLSCAGGVPVWLLPWFAPPPMPAHRSLRGCGFYSQPRGPPCSTLQPAGRTCLPITLQMDSSGLWKCTGTGMLECPVWANNSDFGVKTVAICLHNELQAHKAASLLAH